VTTSSWPVPMRLSKFQCWPSSVEEKTWPSEVPRKILLALCGAASREITVPPEGPTCRHCCAGVDIVAAKLNAKKPIHFAFIRVDSPRAQVRPQGRSLKYASSCTRLSKRPELGQVS